jgi:hypothetical protein
MNITNASHVNEAIASAISHDNLKNFEDLDCALIDEDPQGHHTFQASPAMTEAILSMLTAL